MPAVLRPATPDDAPAVLEVMRESFGDLARRMGGESHWDEDLSPGYPRVRHLATTDPGGAWIAEDEGKPVGAALALVREGLWGLSLLVVSPSHQSAGLGRTLLGAALRTAEGTRGGIILASEDSRALRIYSRAGFDLRPAMDATGQVKRRPAAGTGVRAGRWPEDRELVDASGRLVRTAGHGTEIPVWLGGGGRLFVHDDGGFTVLSEGEVKVLAAAEPEIAAALLRTALGEIPEGTRAEVEFISGGQDWAFETVLEAGLDLRPSGAVMARGDAGPLRPYLPSGAYL